MKLLKITTVLLFVLAGKFNQLHAQTNNPLVADTLHLTLDSAEARFLRQNFQLLAQKYNVDATKAQIIQAKLYANPNLAVSTALYNPSAKKFFPAPFSNDGEFQASLTQLIYLAGKRNKQIKIAEANAKLSEYEFYDVLRTLKYTLRTDFFNIYFLEQSIKVYNEEITSLQQVVNAFNEQQGKGYISEKEVVRVKAQLYSLQSEYNDMINQLNDVQSEMRLIIQEKKVYITPQLDSNSVTGVDPLKYALSTLVDSAYIGRTDLMIAKANTDISKLNYNYQKSLAVPDLSTNLSFDQQGSYVNNFSSIGVAIDLPFFNRNQGNIKTAKSMIDYSLAAQKSTEATVEENVYRALQKAVDADKMYKNIDPKFANDFDRLMHEVLNNYQKRNITLLDFLDFYDSYKQNILQLNALKFNKVSALEDINFYTGTNFFN
jgi:cobalt-zinc-cadmium efflux system outer membrane protein